MNATELDTAIAATPGERVTEADLDAAIVGTEYMRNVGAQGTLTICVLSLRNGFTTTGESACVDPANYRRDIGDTIAYNNARNKIWLLEGYALAERRHTAFKLALNASAPSQPDGWGRAETYIGTKVVHATPMTRGVYNETRGWDTPADEDPNDAGYFIEYADGGGRANVPGFTGYCSWSPADVFEAAYKRAK